MIRGRCARPKLAVLTVAALGLLLAYLVSVPPHLVHHLFDGDDHGRPPCPHLAHGQQAPGIPAGAPAVVPSPAPAGAVLAALPGARPGADRPAERPRAPPLA